MHLSAPSNFSILSMLQNMRGIKILTDVRPWNIYLSVRGNHRNWYSMEQKLQAWPECRPNVWRWAYLNHFPEQASWSILKPVVLLLLSWQKDFFNLSMYKESALQGASLILVCHPAFPQEWHLLLRALLSLTIVGLFTWALLDLDTELCVVHPSGEMGTLTGVSLHIWASLIFQIISN